MSVTETVQYRRKREGRTNYKKRLVYLKSGVPRLVIRKTNTQVILQIIKYEPDGDKIVCGASSGQLKKLGWAFSCKNIPACYLAGMLIAKKAKEHKVEHAIADFGLQTNVAGSKLFAVLKGAVEGGLDVPADEETFPAEDRIKGSHIATHFKNAAPSQFSKYKSDKHDPAKMAEAIAAVKKKITQG